MLVQWLILCLFLTRLYFHMPWGVWESRTNILHSDKSSALKFCKSNMFVQENIYQRSLWRLKPKQSKQSIHVYFPKKLEKTAHRKRAALKRNS